MDQELRHLLNTLLCIFPLLVFSQHEFVGKYYGIAENDSIGKIGITFDLKEDCTYIITADFDYYNIPYEGACFDGERWVYKGTWTSYEDYIFFRVCEDDYLKGKDSCSCCDVHNDHFDFTSWDKLTAFKSPKAEYNYLEKKRKDFAPFVEAGYIFEPLIINRETHEIFFHYGWDCHSDVWIYNAVKRIQPE